MNNGKKHMVWLTLEEIEKVKEILPDVEYQLLYGRRAYRRKYYVDHIVMNIINYEVICSPQHL